MKYQAPEIELLRFAIEDIITTSGEPEDELQNANSVPNEEISLFGNDDTPAIEEKTAPETIDEEVVEQGGDSSN